MNSHHYGVPKQLYRTSYSPNIEAARPSSLHNLTYAQSYLTRSPLVRLEQTNATPNPRELSKTSLSASQSSLQEEKVKYPSQQYYPQSNQADAIKLLQQKYQELARKVLKNSQDIKILKKPGLDIPRIEGEWSEELGKLKRRQQEQHQECLSKIKFIQGQLAEVEAKITKTESLTQERLGSKIEEKQFFKIKALVEERVKQETLKIKLIIDNQISKISHDLRWEIEKDKNSAPIKSRMKYPFSSTKIMHLESLQAAYAKPKTNSRMSTRESSDSPRSGKVLMSCATTYYIDQEGFLLDENNYYLLDSEQKMIRLDSKMLEELRREGLLQ